jgi:hypothetical protein
MTPNSKLAPYNRSALTGYTINNFAYNLDSDTDNLDYTSTEDELLISDLEFKKALEKHTGISIIHLLT